ncbi:MAG: hypothetical protein P8181_16065 [bacterium]
MMVAAVRTSALDHLRGPAEMNSSHTMITGRNMRMFALASADSPSKNPAIANRPSPEAVPLPRRTASIVIFRSVPSHIINIWLS